MQEVSVDEAAKTFSDLLQKVIMGEEVFILQNHKPVAKLVSVGANRKSLKKRIQAGSAKGLVKLAPDFDAPLEDFQEYME
jgi:antitoxin (DNA-binding transcriptional repressor) of toxin-antitoxin stability system